jgi:hypothetical protein
MARRFGGEREKIEVLYTHSFEDFPTIGYAFGIAERTGHPGQNHIPRFLFVYVRGHELRNIFK